MSETEQLIAIVAIALVSFFVIAEWLSRRLRKRRAALTDAAVPVVRVVPTDDPAPPNAADATRNPDP